MKVFFLAMLIFLMNSCGDEISILRSSRVDDGSDATSLFGQSPPSASNGKCAMKGPLFRTANGGCQSCVNNIVFRLPSSPRLNTHDQAVATCKSMGAGWRLPVNEDMNQVLGSFDEVSRYLPYTGAEHGPRFFWNTGVLPNYDPKRAANASTFAGKRFSVNWGDLLSAGKLNEASVVCVKEAPRSCEDPLVVMNPSTALVGRAAITGDLSFNVKDSVNDKVGTRAKAADDVLIVDVNDKEQPFSQIDGHRVAYKGNTIRILPDQLGNCSKETDKFKTQREGCEYTYNSGAKLTIFSFFADIPAAMSYVRGGYEVIDNLYKNEDAFLNVEYTDGGKFSTPNCGFLPCGSFDLSPFPKELTIPANCSQLGDGFRLITKTEWKGLVKETRGDITPLLYGRSLETRHGGSAWVASADGKLELYPPNPRSAEPAGYVFCAKTSENKKRIVSQFDVVQGKFTFGGSSGTVDAKGISLATLHDSMATDVRIMSGFNLASGLGVNSFQLFGRYQGPGDSNMYLAQVVDLNGSYEFSLQKNVNGVWTRLTQKTVGFPLDFYYEDYVGIGIVLSEINGGLLNFVISGDKLTLYFKDKVILQATDSSIPGEGLVGLRAKIKKLPTSAGIRGTVLFSQFKAYRDPVLPLTDLRAIQPWIADEEKRVAPK